MSVLIKGGRVVTAADDYVADVFIEGERITLIGESLDRAADKVIDASGKYVLPGCVDPHTHLAMPWRGETTIDDFTSGHTAAAFGGTTTHVDLLHRGQRRDLRGRTRRWHGKREGKSLIATASTWPSPTCARRSSLSELASLPDEHGSRRYKLFDGLQDR